MTKEDKYILAEWAVNYALKSGAQQAKAIVYEGQKSSVEVREEKIDKLEQSTRLGMGISLYVDNKYSTHNTNRLNNKKELESFIKEAVEGTKYLSEDEFRSLPDPQLYFNGEVKDLKIADSQYASIDPQKKIQMAFNVEKQILGKDDRIISVTSTYYDSMSNKVMVTSNGFKGDVSSTYYGLDASVSINGGEARPSGDWGKSSLFFNDLDIKGIGEIALKRGLDKIGQTKIKSAKMPMILENKLAARSLGPLISAMKASAIQQQNSFLIDKIGAKIGSDLLTLTEDPFVESGRGSAMFDSEGLALKKRVVVDKGVLKEYYIDTYYGKKLGVEPTTGSTTNLILAPGKKSLEEIVASTDRGILVSGINGGNSNGTTGDFSYGVEGFLIENGKRVKAISEMNITGNILELFANLVEVGGDVYIESSWLVPSIKFKDVGFSGL